MIAGSDSREKRFGLLGHDITYTLSPIIHSAIFKKSKIKASYSVVDVGQDKFQETIRDMVTGYDGFNITKPYKSMALKFVKKLSPEAKKCQNINTVFGNTGYNTDYSAITSIFRHKFGNLEGGKCTIFGSGSAATTSAVAFGEMGNSLTIICRNPGEGRKIADHLCGIGLGKPDIIGLQYAREVDSDVVVNAISSGNIEFPRITCEVAVNFNYGERGNNFYDSVMSYHGKITGEEILLAQAIDAEQIWTGIRTEITWEEIFSVKQPR